MLELIGRFTDAIEKRAEWIIGACVACVLMVGFAYSRYLGLALRYADETLYLNTAVRLATDGSFWFGNLRAGCPPLYPGLLAGLIKCGASVEWLRVANFVLLGASAILAHRVARAFTEGRLTGVMAAGWVCTYPAFGYVAGTLYPQTLATFLLLGCVSIVAHGKQLCLVKGVVGGVLLGMLILTAPAFVGIGIGLAVWVLVTSKGFRVREALAFGMGVVLALTPWTIRNYAVFDRFVFVSTQGGQELLIGNSEHARPGLGASVDIRRYRERVMELDEVERDRAYRKFAVEWIQGHPAEAGRLYIGKLRQHFGVREVLATRSEVSELKSVALALSYIPLLSSAVVRVLLFKVRRVHPVEWGLLALYMVHACTLAVFHTRIRYRLPTDALLMPVAARAIAVSMEWVGKGGIRVSQGGRLGGRSHMAGAIDGTQ